MQPYLAITEQHLFEWQQEDWVLVSVLPITEGAERKRERFAFRSSVPYKEICDYLVEFYDAKGYAYAQPWWIAWGKAPGLGTKWVRDLSVFKR